MAHWCRSGIVITFGLDSDSFLHAKQLSLKIDSDISKRKWEKQAAFYSVDCGLLRESVEIMRIQLRESVEIMKIQLQESVEIMKIHLTSSMVAGITQSTDSLLVGG